MDKTTARHKWILTEDSGQPECNEVVVPKVAAVVGVAFFIRKDLISSGGWYIANHWVACSFQSPFVKKV